MPTRVKIDPIERDVNAIVSADLSPDAQKAAIGAFAREQLEDAKAINKQALGHIPRYTVFVDGNEGARFESVQPRGGTISIEFELVNDVIGWIGQTLIDRSPKRTGEYVRGHTLFADGQQVPIGTQVPEASEYSFSNLVPYARKIEIGKTKSGRAFVVQVPNRIYELTARDARGRFGNIAKVTFTYRSIAGFGSRRDSRAPTIVVTPR